MACHVIVLAVAWRCVRVFACLRISILACIGVCWCVGNQLGGMSACRHISLLACRGISLLVCWYVSDFSAGFRIWIKML